MTPSAIVAAVYLSSDAWDLDDDDAVASCLIVGGYSPRELMQQWEEIKAEARRLRAEKDKPHDTRP